MNFSREKLGLLAITIVIIVAITFANFKEKFSPFIEKTKKADGSIKTFCKARKSYNKDRNCSSLPKVVDFPQNSGNFQPFKDF